MLEVVDRCTKQELSALAGVRLLPLGSRRFDGVVIVPGHLTRHHEPPLGEVMHRLYPVRRWEVQDGMGLGAFERLLSSKVGLHLIDWRIRRTSAGPSHNGSLRQLPPLLLPGPEGPAGIALIQ
jgi:hypothetical protein